MVFSSFIFLFPFFLALMALYFLLPARWREGRNLLLLAFSLFFYACGGLRDFPLILVSIAVNYLFGLLVNGGRARLWLWLAVAVNLGLLGWFKYAGFLAGVLQGIGIPVPVPEIALPIGISFFTFQGMSYVIDVCRGEAPPAKNPLHVALYIALFPQLVAGPIVRYTTVAEEIVSRRESLDEFAAGGVRLCFGLAKKMLLANSLGQLADAAFGAYAPTMALAWMGALAYTGQIYFDFSAYSDMAIGLGRIFGFHFLENFNYPYVSQSITEFWRRWHISLSSWFRDYVYIPLGGSRCGLGRQIRNIFVVWLLTGFWHGADWSFIFWGLYFALLLLGERFLWKRALERAPRPLRHLYAMALVILGWVLFRGERIDVIARMLSAMFGGTLTDGYAVYCWKQYGWALLMAIPAALPLKPLLQRWLEKREGTLSRAVSAFAPPLLALGLLGLSFMRLLSSTFNPFIYFRF